MCLEFVLGIWSVAGATWWILAWWLVRADRPAPLAAAGAVPRSTLSLFKPLPPLGTAGLGLVAAGLESFVAQLDDTSEMLLGVHEFDRETIAHLLLRLRESFPRARIKTVFRTEPDDMANPKIAWQRYLAPHAEGELWLWSDADIIASAGFLRSARDAFAGSDARMVTFPYAVRALPSPPALLEALFVNVEFYPGVLLLRRFGAVDFGLGAAMLFRRDDFLREVDWDEIGSRLADDFFLGQKLRAVRIGTPTLATVPAMSTWPDAVAHDLRWSKTIRWNRPMGFFSRLLILPVLGWLVAVALEPTHFYVWLGLVGMIQADVLAAAAICRRTGCRLKGGDLLRLELWSVWRVALWFLTWIPGAVSWRGKMWRRPQAELSEINLTTT